MEKNFTIDLSGEEKGVYFLVMEGEVWSTFEKILLTW